MKKQKFYCANKTENTEYKCLLVPCPDKSANPKRYASYNKKGIFVACISLNNIKHKDCLLMKGQ